MISFEHTNEQPTVQKFIGNIHPKNTSEKKSLCNSLLIANKTQQPCSDALGDAFRCSFLTDNLQVYSKCHQFAVYPANPTSSMSNTSPRTGKLPSQSQISATAFVYFQPKLKTHTA